MSPSPQWYVQQASLYYERPDECRRIAVALESSPLPALLQLAGPDTFQCPAAEQFRDDLLMGQRRVLDAIDTLNANIVGLIADGDEMSRAGAAAAERERHDDAERAAELRRPVPEFSS